MKHVEDRAEKLDDASWHLEAYAGTNTEAPSFSTHIGIFVRWCMLRGGVNLSQSRYPLELSDANLVKNGEMTGTEFVDYWWDSKLFDNWLQGDIRAFAKAYYSIQGDMGDLSYLDDYERIVGAKMYEVAETEELFREISDILDERYRVFVERSGDRKEPKG